MMDYSTLARGSTGSPSFYMTSGAGNNNNHPHALPPRRGSASGYWTPQSMVNPPRYADAGSCYSEYNRGTSDTPTRYNRAVNGSSPPSLSSLYYSTPRKERPISERENPIASRTSSPGLPRMRTRIPSMVHDRATSALVPPQDPHFHQRYVVVLDLDETLVYAREGPILSRPGCTPLLQLLVELGCETLVWTAGERDYAQDVIRRIDPHGSIQHCVYRHEKWWTGRAGYCKDLRMLGRSMEYVLMIDNTPDCLRVNPENGLLVSDFTNLPHADDVLPALGRFIRDLVMSQLPVASFLRRSDKVQTRKVRSEVHGEYDLYALTMDKMADGYPVANPDLEASTNPRAAPRFSAWSANAPYVVPQLPASLSSSLPGSGCNTPLQGTPRKTRPTNAWDTYACSTPTTVGTTPRVATPTHASYNNNNNNNIHNNNNVNSSRYENHRSTIGGSNASTFYHAPPGHHEAAASRATMGYGGAGVHPNRSFYDPAPLSSGTGSRFSTSGTGASLYTPKPPTHSDPFQSTCGMNNAINKHPFSNTMTNTVDWLTNAPTRSRDTPMHSSAPRGRCDSMNRVSSSSNGTWKVSGISNNMEQAKAQPPTAGYSTPFRTRDHTPFHDIYVNADRRSYGTPTSSNNNNSPSLYAL